MKGRRKMEQPMENAQKKGVGWEREERRKRRKLSRMKLGSHIR